MPRDVLSDPLQSHTFWLFDAAPISSLALPIFAPLGGFTTCTMPEITLDTQEITEGNWFWKRKIVTGASIGNITLTKGATIANSDFYRWTTAALAGDTRGNRFSFQGTTVTGALEVGGPTPRRTLILVQFLARSPFADPQITAAIAGVGMAALGLASGSVTGVATSGAGILTAGQSAPILDFAPRIPAKAWILSGCLPVRYKPGSDFDANNDEISMAEIELAVEEMEELSLAA